MSTDFKFAIIGSGMLGSAIAQGLLNSGFAGKNLVIVNRSGNPCALDGGEHVTFMTEPQMAVDRSDVVLLCVPPGAARALKINAPKALVLSVVAGLSLKEIGALTGTERMIRAMSSPAAAMRLAYSPWVASANVTMQDRAITTAIFAAIGTTDEITDEAHIDDFTAMTGPVPGFVAYFADSMIRHAIGRGIPADIAARAIRQLFHASGEMLKDGQTPSAHMAEMIDYAGTTAEGLLALRDSTFDAALSEALTAATKKAQRI